MQIIAILITIVSGCVALYGLLQTSQATLGASLIAFACYLGIIARLAQASEHNGQLATNLKKMREWMGGLTLLLPELLGKQQDQTKQ